VPSAAEIPARLRPAGIRNLALLSYKFHFFWKDYLNTANVLSQNVKNPSTELNSGKAKVTWTV